MPVDRVGACDDWPTLGWEIVDWIEAYLCHGPGDVQGEPFLLDVEEVQLLLDCYRLYPPDHERAGRRVVSRAVYSRMKGRRKSELAGALTCAEARAPVRFDGWKTKDDKVVPVGRPVRSPFIRCLATEEEQSGNTYDNVTLMLEYAAERHPEEFGGIDIGRSPQGSTRIFLPGGGEIRPSTASSAAKDGGKESFTTFDEPHLYILPSLRAMHRTVRRNLAKRKAAEPWSLETTTGYMPGQESIAEAAALRAKAIIEGRAVGRGFYWNHREGCEVEDWSDDGQVLAALVDAAGEAAEWTPVTRILEEEIRDPDATEADSRRYWLNQSRKGGGSAFDVARWGELAKPETVVADKERIVIGFDGAKFHDATALIATHIETGHQWPLGIWERPYGPDGDDWEVPEDEVDAALTLAFDTHKVWRVYADPPYWEEMIARWTSRWGARRVVKWWTNRQKPMAYALRAYATAQQAGELSHDGDSTFARHIGNARAHETRIKDEAGRLMWTIRKEHPSSPNKIDAAMAGCLSWEARTDAIATGALRKGSRTSRASAV